MTGTSTGAYKAAQTRAENRDDHSSKGSQASHRKENEAGSSRSAEKSSHGNARSDREMSAKSSKHDKM